jgi:diguanylate cyclase (GGDEF)-like protein
MTPLEKISEHPPHTNYSASLILPGLKMSAHGKKKITDRSARSKGRVLLIADHEQATLIELLAAKGIDVVGVSTAAAAMVSLQRARPHLVVANPKATGLRVNELSKMLDQTDDGIPLILAGSMAATHEKRLQAVSSGAFDYFELPAEIELLVKRSEQLIQLRQKIDRLRAEADLDSLTGLANRRRFRVALIREVERWKRYGAPCALLLIDIDHLKKINDKFGHPAGDLVIRQVAQTLSEVSRDNDTAARLGGEEFALLLASTDVGKASSAAERLREVLSRKTVEGVGSVTVSIGVAGCPTSGTADRTLYLASDQALYVAKNGGRNRIAVAPPLQDTLPGV